jgi:hypothetical protein
MNRIRTLPLWEAKMALWFQEAVAAVSMLIFVASALVLAFAGEALLT